MIKKINLDDQKKILKDILQYVDKICRDNGIKYSLLGGSLIGAVRHDGFIPWDDDIDIVLMPKEYKKLMKILSSQKGRYSLFVPGVTESYYYPFAKLIDTFTIIEEDGIKQNDDYGVYLDIFKYHHVSKHKFLRYLYYQKISFVKWLLGASMRKKFPNEMLPAKLLNKIYLGSYGGKEKRTEHLISNWPAYGFEKEIQLAKNTEEYIDVKFENLKVMIFKNYDEILRTTFGDYMQLPPESERIPKHNMKAWWREGYENEAKKLRNRMRKEEKDGKTKR